MPHRAPHRTLSPPWWWCRRPGTEPAAAASLAAALAWGRGRAWAWRAGRSRATAAACPSSAVGDSCLLPHSPVRSRFPELLLPAPHSDRAGPSRSPPRAGTPLPVGGPSTGRGPAAPGAERRPRLRLQTAARGPVVPPGRNPHSPALLGYLGQCETGVRPGSPRGARPDLSFSLSPSLLSPSQSDERSLQARSAGPGFSRGGVSILLAPGCVWWRRPSLAVPGCPCPL